MATTDSTSTHTRENFANSKTLQEIQDLQSSNPHINPPDLLKVSSKSSPASVAGAIAGMIKDGAKVEVQSVGAGAVNQAVKAIAISRGFLSPVGIEIASVPYFADIVINGEARTAIRFKVEPMKPVSLEDIIADQLANDEQPVF